MKPLPNISSNESLNIVTLPEIVESVGLDEQVIQEYIKNQERDEMHQEQMRLAGNS